MFMNLKIIHDNHRVWSQIGTHVFKKTFDEWIKCLSTKWTFNNVTVDNSIMKWKCRKNRESREKLGSQCKCHSCSKMITYHHPQMKKAFHWALVPQIDHAQPLYVVQQLTEDSSTKMSCSGLYLPILEIYSRCFSADCSAAMQVS